MLTQFEAGTKVQGYYLDTPYVGIVQSVRVHTMDFTRIETTIELAEDMDGEFPYQAGSKIIVSSTHDGDTHAADPDSYGKSTVKLWFDGGVK